MKPKITIVVPAVGEEATIQRVLRTIEETVQTPNEVIVVQDVVGRDKTGELVKQFRRKHANVFLIQKQKSSKSSFARALLLGFQTAKGAYVLPVMADGCDDAGDIDAMYRLAQKGWDVVCGSRYMRGGKKSGGPVIQSVLSYLTCVTLRFFTGIPTTDVSNSFKLYKKEILKKISIDPAGGTEVSMSITLQAYVSGAKILDIPTTWCGSDAGSELRIFKRTKGYATVYLYALKQTLAKWLPL